MISQNLKLAIRNLVRNRYFTIINLTAIATSLAACIVIFTYYSFECSYDKHIPNADRCYRVITRLGEGQFWARSFACFGDALADRPEIEDLTSFISTTDNIITVGESSYTITEAVIGDTSFLDFFEINIISGRMEDLGQPNKVFITTKLAEILFPGGEPLGKEIFFKQFEGNTSDSLGYFTIAGIVEPLPDNTHFGFQMIFSRKGNLDGWINNLKGGKWFSANVYVRLYNNLMATELENGLMESVVPFLENRPGPPVEAFNSKLQAVRDIHFTTNLNREPRSVVRKSMILILLSVGFLILILMTLNFISTAIVQSHEQRKNTGIMRALGAKNIQLFQLSLFKISLFVGLSLLISWTIIAFMESNLQNLFGSVWSFRSLSFKIILGGLVAGIPVILIVATGMHISGYKYNTDDLLRGKTITGKGAFSVFGILTVVQFTIVTVLLGFSIFINRQITYMNNMDLGYSSRNIFVVRLPSQTPRGSLLVEEIKGQPGVISASTAHHHPGDLYQSMEFSAGDKKYQFGFRMVDQGIFETLEINMVKRFGSADAEMKGWVINESFYNNLLIDFSEEDIAASNFRVENDNPEDSRSKFLIAGVMKDFHYSSLHNQIGNFAFAIRPPELYNRWLLVRFMEYQSEPVLKAIHNMMDTHFPGRDYELLLLEDSLNEKYEASRKLSRVITIFTLLSILIASFGLYGLSMFISQRRTREIGIRKVFGAGYWQILYILNMGFLKWVGIALLIACPLTVWTLKKWLQNFAYKTDLPWWIFLLIGFIVACIALLAVSWQTSSAANSNPVDAIRQD